MSADTPVRGQGVRGQGCLQAGMSADTLSQSAYRPGHSALFFFQMKKDKTAKPKYTYYTVLS